MRFDHFPLANGFIAKSKEYVIDRGLPGNTVMVQSQSDSISSLSNGIVFLITSIEDDTSLVVKYKTRYVTYHHVRGLSVKQNQQLLVGSFIGLATYDSFTKQYFVPISIAEKNHFLSPAKLIIFIKSTNFRSGRFR